MASRVNNDCHHGNNSEDVEYLKREGYTDVRDDQCCKCYFQPLFKLTSEELDNKTNDTTTHSS